METGDNILQRNFLTDPDLDSEKFKDCHTVLHLAGDGMSMAVFNNTGKHLLASDNYEWEYTGESKTLIQNIKDKIEDHPLLLSDCQSLKFILANDKISLVPKDLYDDNKKSRYFQFSSRVENDGLILSDTWNEHHAIALYSPDLKTMEWIKGDYPNAQIIHSSTALKNLYNYFPQTGLFAFLMIGNGYAELFIGKNGKVVFYNYFNFGVEEDLLYYILFALEQNRILAPEIDLLIGGKLHKRQKLWIMLEDYIGKVKLMEVPSVFSLSTALNHHTINRYINLFGGI